MSDNTSGEVEPDLAAQAHHEGFPPKSGAPVWVRSGRYEEEWFFDAQMHAQVEIGVVLSGQAERQYQDVRLPGLPGDVWLCAMWELHGWRVRVPETDRVVVNFLPEYLGDEMFGGLHWYTLFSVPVSQRPKTSSPEMRQRVLAIGRELGEEIERSEPDWETAVRLLVLRLLFTLSRGWRPMTAADGTGPADRSHLSRLLPALARLRERGSDPPTLAEAAAACGLQRSQFSVLFRQTMGTTFGKFRTRARLSAAAQLLLATDLPVAEVASRTGFADASHLGRAFTRHYACTPGEYRTRGR